MFALRMTACGFTGISALAAGIAVGAPPVQGPMGIRSGRVDYKVTLQGNSGAQSLAWTEFGARWRQDLTITYAMPGTPARPVSEWTILNGKNYYNGQSSTRTATRVVLSPDARRKVLIGGMPTTGKAGGNAVVLGKRCEVRQGEGYKVWVWKGVPLRYEATPQKNGLGMSIVATQIREDVKLPNTLFTTPAGYKIITTRPPG